MRNLNIIWFLVLLLLMTACAKEAKESADKPIAEEDTRMLWASALHSKMLNDMQSDALKEIGELIYNAHRDFDISVHQSLANFCDTALAQSTELLKPQDVSSLVTSTQTYPAKANLINNRIKQLVILQGSAFRQCIIDQNLFEQTLLTSNNTEFIEVFLKLKSTYESFTKGELQLYSIDEEASLLAYSLIYGSQRVFIAFNFSYDIHEMPLPFGFMTSTKVTFWQSDAIKAETFVTSSPLMIRPFTANIVIVE